MVIRWYLRNRCGRKGSRKKSIFLVARPLELSGHRIFFSLKIAKTVFDKKFSQQLLDYKNYDFATRQQKTKIVKAKYVLFYIANKPKKNIFLSGPAFTSPPLSDRETKKNTFCGCSKEQSLFKAFDLTESSHTSDFFLRTDLFSIMRAQHTLSYHLI